MHGTLPDPEPVPPIGRTVSDNWPVAAVVFDLGMTHSGEGSVLVQFGTWWVLEYNTHANSNEGCLGC